MIKLLQKICDVFGHDYFKRGSIKYCKRCKKVKIRDKFEPHFCVGETNNKNGGRK